VLFLAAASEYSPSGVAGLRTLLPGRAMIACITLSFVTNQAIFCFLTSRP